MRTWTRSDPRWQALSPFQRAAAMALMEANAMNPDAARNALGAMINRSKAENVPLGEHVSQAIYQPTIEANQQARLDRILHSPSFGELTGWAERRYNGQEADPVSGATHFLAPEKTMLALEAREPNKYRSWRKWTGYDPETGGYQGVVMRDGSHAFLRLGEPTPEARQGSINGGMGISPTGSAGISGPIHTANPVGPETLSGFSDFKPVTSPETQVAGADGMGMLDFNDATLGSALGQFGSWLGKMGGKKETPPRVDMVEARGFAPNVRLEPNVVAALLQKRAKLGT